MGEGDTLVNALIGAVAGAVASAITGPVGPLIGGGVAGYLEGGERADGLRVGTITGLVSLVPMVLGGVVVLALLGVVGFGLLLDPTAVFAVGAVGAVLVIGGLAAIALTTVALSALGGWVGNYLKYDTDL
ncbi:DUF5518 domain-containing protein [Halomicrobium salinisoli]|uniref:DUF5518 domain-containing protein n=1 Tax=Halomicrobium salinisoli TaxID=2878391 RepID=UPI001CF07F61|nr:DUF5518 domain-containing protein [Halomicrobium salinisoli]